MVAVRIKTYKVTPAGARGLLNIPGDQIKNLELSDDGEVTMYAGILDGKNVLILAKTDAPRLVIGE
jgi:hypothetical protein